MTEPNGNLPGADADRSRPSYGQQGESTNAANPTNSTSDTANNTAPYAQQSPAQSSSQNPFGSYPSNDSAVQGNSQPPKKKKLGPILTIIGALLTVIGIIIMIVGASVGVGKAIEALPTNLGENVSSFANGSTESSFQIENLEVVMVYVPQADAANVTCIATMDDGLVLPYETFTSQNSETVQVGGDTYIPHEQIFYSKDSAGSGTLSCNNVSAPVYLVGPIDAIGLFSWFFGGLLVGGLLAFLGFALLIAGIITWIVQRKNYNKAVRGY